jgi:Tol biopolymer transport system component
VLFFSNGTNLVANAIYKRNFHTGAMSRITRNPFDGGGGNDLMVHVWSDYDASHIVFSSYASNLVPNDYNELLDIFLYTAADGSTRRITMGYAGEEANGTSGQPFISMDGRFVVFRSDASNLVPGDTNGVGDVFLYNVETGQTTRASVGSGGQQANGLSRDPSVCANGRYVSFTSEADNLVSGDNNGEHDVFLHNTETGETILISKTDSGVIGNGRSHRSFLVPDCSGIVFASDATNFVPNDTNNSRDMFMTQIATTPDFSRTTMNCGAAVSPGETVQHSIQFVNDGTDAGAASFVSPIPTGAALITDSLSAGLTYNAVAQQVEWSGTVAGGSSITFAYQLQIDDGLVGPTAVSSTAVWTADGRSHDVFCAAVVDGIPAYLPIVSR